jgi:hypothetical protein
VKTFKIIFDSTSIFGWQCEMRHNGNEQYCLFRRYIAYVAVFYLTAFILVLFVSVKRPSPQIRLA